MTLGAIYGKLKNTISLDISPHLRLQLDQGENCAVRSAFYLQVDIPSRTVQICQGWLCLKDYGGGWGDGRGRSGEVAREERRTESC